MFSVWSCSFLDTESYELGNSPEGKMNALLLQGPENHKLCFLFLALIRDLVHPTGTHIQLDCSWADGTRYLASSSAERASDVTLSPS